MEILIEIIHALRDLSGPALWVGMTAIVLLFGYKIAIVGSIYGVVRFACTKLAEVTMQPQHEKRVIDVSAELNGVTISDCHEALISEVKRIRNKGIASGSRYIHMSDVDWLRQAIDEKIERDKQP